ncbi:uncharacterized protein LOC134531542 isoform X4 [Bacillus rossius redtenbacheri]|uniref:uncharacterized protein LOC134531542 isoform X4 n=1 Tax=Bacillus rossius redtenbacheri TaxID=93214 RepID=UPI002FDDE273
MNAYFYCLKKMFVLVFAMMCVFTPTVYGFVDELSLSVKNNNISKRYDLDLQTCIENFDVHLDKIIRTQDSRAMGANYINEFDVGSREECLRLCCETDTCDVFVFEEKSPGSCYLFHCGSPDDFKCKFTKHHNYTSAVLTASKHASELESQIKLTKHEEELTRLRKPPQVAAEATAALFPPTTNSPSREVVPLAVATPNTLTSRRCSRYQFECRSSGECIAIYNACDGIPQCSDSSDEAAELGCPAQAVVTTPAAPVTVPRQPGAPYAWQREPVSGVSPEGHRPSGNTAPEQHFPPAPPAPGSLLYGREGEGYVQWPAYQQYRKQYDDGGNSHIFNHKSSGLVSETDSPAGSYGEGLRAGYYVGGSGDTVPRYRQPVPGGWPQQADSHDEGMRGSKLSPDYYYEDGQEGRFRGHRPPAPLPAPRGKGQQQLVPAETLPQRKGSIAVEVLEPQSSTTTTTPTTTAATTAAVVPPTTSLPTTATTKFVPTRGYFDNIAVVYTTRLGSLQRSD